MHRRKKSVLFLCLLLLPLSCAHTPEAGKGTPRKDTAVAATETGVPRAEVPESSFDFGEMKQGQDYVHAFVVRNAGTGVLEIKKIIPA